MGLVADLDRERFALARRAAGLGAWDWNIETGNLAWSEEIEPMFGFAPGKFRKTYEAFLECVHPDDCRYVIDSVNACVEEGEDYDIEHRIVWPDGTVRWMAETGDVIRDDAGRAIRMLGIVRDITERKHAEEKIRDLARFPEENTNPVMRIAGNGEILYSNEASDVLLDAWNTKVGEIAPEPWVRHVGDLLPAGEAGSFDCECGRRVYSLTMVPLKGPGYVNVYGADVTTRRRMERALRKAYKKVEQRVQERTQELTQAYSNLKQIYDAAGDGMRVIDNDFNVLSVNRTLLDMLGTTEDAVVGRKCFETLRSRLCNTADCPLNRIRNGDERFEMEIEKQLADGSTFYGLLSATPYRDARERLVGIVEDIRDITEKKETERELVRARQMELFGKLTAGVAHEVRNPLNAILALFEALFQELDEPDRFAEYREYIDVEIRRMSRLMEDLLQIGRPLKLSDMDVRPLTELCETSCRQFEVRHGTTHRVRFEPPGDDCLEVLCDHVRLEQVFVNLIENAVQHSPEGSEIVLTLSRGDGATALVTVRDQGPGVPPENMEKIFDAFFSTRKKGTGLGLSIVRHIVESHRGKVRAYNNDPGPGLSVEIRLPLASAGD
jgi:PAS domain S-box-containing protein